MITYIKKQITKLFNIPFIFNNMVRILLLFILYVIIFITSGFLYGFLYSVIYSVVMIMFFYILYKYRHR